MQKRYETVFILTPVLSDVQVKEAVEKFKQVIQDSGSKVLHQEDWGLKKMAYPIQKKSTGFYQLLEFESPDGTSTEALEVAYRRDERVMRYLTVALDKDAIEYGEKRKAKMKESKSK